MASKDMQVPSEDAMVSHDPLYSGSVNQVVIWVTTVAGGAGGAEIAVSGGAGVDA